MKKFIASFIASIIVLTAPGLSSYAAAANIIKAPAPIAPAGATPIVVPVGQMPSNGILPGVLKLDVVQSPKMTDVRFETSAQSKIIPMPDPFTSELKRTSTSKQTSDDRKGPMELLLAQKGAISIPDAKMPAGQLRTWAADSMDRLLGIIPAKTAQDAVTAPANPRSSVQLAPAKRGPAPIAPKSRISGAVGFVGRTAAGAGAVVGLQTLAVHFAPAIFGLVPMAAVLAVSAGVFLLPISLYVRHRYSLHDSPRLTKIKWLMDGAIGVFIGACLVAAPGLGAIVSMKGLALAGMPLAASFIGRSAGRVRSLPDSAANFFSLVVLPKLLGVAAVGTISLGALTGGLALVVMTTLSFFAGWIITDAEKGRPFSVPGSMQKLRFPSSPWVMLGVICSTFMGLSPLYSGTVFFVWQFLGQRTFEWRKGAPLWQNLLSNLLNFNVLYVGLLAIVVATPFVTGALSPLTFLAVAFLFERGALATEGLLGKLLPKSEPAPSTDVKPLADPIAAADQPARWPRFHYWWKTSLLIISLAGVGLALGPSYGFMSFAKNLGIAAAFSAASLFLSTKIIKVVMKDTPADPKDSPEFFAVMNDLRDLTNAKRAQEGKKPIPMPEMLKDPMEGPNAYASGWSPFHSIVAVTKGITEMLLDAENFRADLIRRMASSEAGDKKFMLYRDTIAGSVPGVPADATPLQVAEAVRQASSEQLKDLGTRAFRGVLAHEVSHIMDRHMVLGAITGAISSAIAFASWGVMWTVGKAQAAAKRLQDWIAAARPRSPLNFAKRMGIRGMQLFVEPVSAVTVGGGLVLLTLLRAFAIIWGPLIAQILQTASSRSNEGMADEDGAKLSKDPGALGLALGLLMNWRPKESRVASDRLPFVAAYANIYTINPIEQMWKAGVLPRLSALAEAVVGHRDTFFADLFSTHPDTNRRIEKLYDMLQAMKVKRP